MRRLFYLIPLVSILSSCQPNNVEENGELEKYFKDNHVQGCFALLSNISNRFTVYNLSRYRDSSFLPASTFKIVNSLIGLQTGVISNDSMIIKWDGVQRANPEWNQDLSMYRAFRLSAVPYYQEVARRIGKDTMQRWLDTLGYGSKKITSRIDTFWLDNTLKIKPDEQLGLVKKLYFEQLPFYKTNQKIVKRAMLMENTPEYDLSYKTGWAPDAGNRQVGWVVGYIEENRHPYFFVLELDTPDKSVNIPELRMKILKGILSELGFMKGQK